ncbi:MAG TPA: hypothetical protein VN520_23685 [Streptomyces sp.]|uniref:hypothetical protein n=1 Tax=Streptomyces sp. TaxID=1931 RepID=UPI002C8D0DB1|nr:hypothetical protein [Streptomyces sp.]HWU09345.1 hypothetical protein [Streptomyces sp.]
MSRTFNCPTWTLRISGASCCSTWLSQRSANWTDTGAIHEERGLKGRAADDTRVVPGHPSLTRILREHIRAEDLKPRDLLFQGEGGELLAGSGIRRAWRSARAAIFTPAEFGSPLGKRVYDLRHTR